MNVTVVIPCFNEEKRLSKCLKSIRCQDTHNFIINIIIVDDYSNDLTVNIANTFDVQILYSGYRDIETSKRIGLEAVSTPLVLFLDADNWLPSNSWVATARRALLEHPEAIGAQSARFFYDRNDPAANRYCSMYGITDPVPFYLRVRDRLMVTEQVWDLGGRVISSTEDHWLLEADEDHFLTFGSQGFLTYAEQAKWSIRAGRFYHMDHVYRCVCLGQREIVLLEQPVGHDGCADAIGFLKKIIRNISLFHVSETRVYIYNISIIDKIRIAIILMTGIIPIIDATRAYLRGPRDFAWFLHPIFCAIVGIIYSWIHLRFLVGKLLGVR